MNALPIKPIGGPLGAVVGVPGSKSITNRALAIAALAEGDTTLTNALFSDDTARFVESLRALGYAVEQRIARGEIGVRGLGGRVPAARAQLNVGNAGTAARFLTALVSLGHGEYVIDGDSRMRQRPIADLLEALGQLGVRAESQTGCPPVTVLASGLRGGIATVAGNISSQFLSGLLMCAPYARRRLELRVQGELNSKPYVDLTLAIMRDFGVVVEREGYDYFGVSPQRYVARHYAIESDASAASYFFAAPALCGGRVRVKDLSRRARQGDVRFADVLAQMGCVVAEGDGGMEVSGGSTLRGVDVDMRDIPDTAQTLAAIAPFASSPTTIRGIASARVKETDRVAAMCNELRRLGVQVQERDDGLTIYPCAAIQPTTVQTYHDHRMAMAFSLIGLRVEGITIENPDCVSKTFPKFFETLDALRRRGDTD